MPFKVEKVAGRRLVLARMSGLFTPDHASGLISAYTKILREFPESSTSLDLVVDMSEAPIQPATVVQVLTDFFRESANAPAHVAFVHGDRPIRMQARRVSAELGGRHFATTGEAMDWLNRVGFL